MPWTIGSPLRWLGTALLSASGEGPTQLEDGPVSTVVDVLQGGHGLAVWEFFTQNYTTAAGGTSTIIPANEKQTRILMISVRKQGATAAADARLAIPGILGSTGSLALWQEAAMGTRFADWSEIGNGAQFFVIPPRFSLIFAWGALAGGDFFEVRAAIGNLPAGTKGW